jgi:hypothetical protein
MHIRCRPGHPGSISPASILIIGCLMACSRDSSSTGVNPTAGVACKTANGSGTITLGAMQTTTVDCSQGGTAFELAGGGASYLLVPELATGDVSIASTSYTLGSPNATANQVLVSAPLLDRAPTIAPGTPARVTENRPGARQRSFDARLRVADRRMVTRGIVGRAQRSVAITGPAKLQVAPDLGSIRPFRVIASTDTAATTVFKTVNARLAYVGTNILLYVDTLTAANGFATGDLSGIGNLFDQTLYPIDINAFGQPSDIDQNGHLIMLMTPVVNSLVTNADCQKDGYIAGFFTGYDLASRSTDSNQGEVFYTVAPDPAGVSSCAHTVSDIEFTVPATFLHEVQHLINFSQHVILHNASEAEEGWLDEGLSRVAEELGSRYYERKFPPPTGRTNPLQLFPDSSQGFIGGVLTNSYAFLLKPDTATVTLHSDSDDGLAWRGSVWLLVRWLGDLKGEDIYKRLEATALTGTANIEAAAGESFQGLFADFGIALYTDSIPGVARSSIPQRDQFVTRNLRQLYAALFRAAGPSADVPRAFPIVVQSIPANQGVSASMLPGTVAYYRVDTPAGSGPVQVRFATPAGMALQASLRPQVAIFRLPPGAG